MKKKESISSITEKDFVVNISNIAMAPLKIHFNKLRRITIVGGLSTLLAYVSFPLIYETIFDYQLFTLSFILASFINVTASYSMQRIFVFKSTKRWFLEYLHFWFNGSLLLAGSFIGLYGLEQWTSMNPFTNNFIIVTVSSIASYVVHDRVTFRKVK